MLNWSSLEATLKHSLNLTFYELCSFQLISCKRYKHILEIKNLTKFACFCFRLMLLRLMMCWTSMILVIALNIHNFCWFFCVHFHMHLGACKIELCRYYFHASRASTHEFLLCKFVEWMLVWDLLADCIAFQSAWSPLFVAFVFDIC
jgi:hypothetical protein